MVFSGSLDGHLRAYDSRDGAVIWDFDTVRAYNTANGVNGERRRDRWPGAGCREWYGVRESGYTRFGGIPGNVLLAFAPEN